MTRAQGYFTATAGKHDYTARLGLPQTVLSNGKVLVVGGYDPTGATLASAELYDPGHRVFTRHREYERAVSASSIIASAMRSLYEPVGL